MSRCRHRSEATATRVWRLGQARMSPWGSRSSSSYPLSLSIYRCIPHVLKGGRQTAEEFFYQSLLKIIVIIIILILIRPKCPSQTAAGRSSLTSRPSKSALESQMQSLWWIQEGYQHYNLFDSYCDQNNHHRLTGAWSWEDGYRDLHRREETSASWACPFIWVSHKQITYIT